MSDMYNNNNNNRRNDIDDFFAEFDRQAAKQNRPSYRDQEPQRSSSYRSQEPQRNASYRSQEPQRSVSYRSVEPQRSASYRSQEPQRRSAASSSSRRPTSTANRFDRARASASKFTDAVKAKTESFSNGRSSMNGGGRSGKSGGKKTSLLSLIIFCALAFILAVGIYVGVIFAIAPRVHTDDIYAMLSQRSIIYDAEGRQIDNLYMSDGNRTIIDYADIPQDMVNAVVAVEDKKFWKHNGFNFIRMVGAIKDSVLGGGNISGTSTVTQQLARNVYLAEIKSQRSLSRKLSEMYCTIVLEKNLSKEEIMEAYLNTIYLGFNSYGIESASQAYFSKSASKMDLLECASFAALPQSPDTYALVKYVPAGTDTSLPVIYKNDTDVYVYNGDLTKERRELILNNMEAEGFITAEQLESAKNDNLKKHIDLTNSKKVSTSYFAEYAINQLTDDLVEEYGITEADAQNMIYTGGLKIYTTMDSDIQKIVEKEFNNSSNFAGIAYARTNSDGALLNSKTGNILLYSYDQYFDDKDRFTLKKGEYSRNSDGGITIKAGKRLNIYQTEVGGAPDVSIEFKGMYTKDNGIFYFIESGALSIPQGYKTVDDDGNVIVSGQFFTDYPTFFKKSDNGLIVEKGNYSLKQKTRQPQGAMVIIENETGEVKAMIGGRETKGRQLYNRAINPRQPGSSMKPIGTYGPALQMSYEYHKDGKKMRLDTSEGSDYGKYITAGSVINDAKMSYGGEVWPKNWYSGYKGDMKLRKCVEQSVNTTAVKVYQQIGPDYSSKMLKKNGITTVDTEGEVNDLNPAALALGGMTSGVSPLEMAAAYATFPNGGVYNTPIAYTKVLDANDEVLIEKKAESKEVYDPGVAWIMTDILRTTVTKGIASGASIGVQPVGGKTGTTSDNYDIWFCGFTPQYSAAVWMGNDVNIEMSSGSGTTARFWSIVMRQVCEDIPYGSFGSMPSNVESVKGEYYIKGTYSKVTMTPSSTDASTKVTKPTTTVPPTTLPTTEATSESSSAASSQATTAPTDSQSNN